MTRTTVFADSAFMTTLKGIASYVRHCVNHADYYPTEYHSDLGSHGLEYGEDEDGNEYALIGFALPEGIYAEIDGDTYGSLYGFRIYLDEGDNDNE